MEKRSAADSYVGLIALLDEPFAGALYFDNGTLAESSSRRSGGP
jgi:hypothetical protein